MNSSSTIVIRRSVIAIDVPQKDAESDAVMDAEAYFLRLAAAFEKSSSSSSESSICLFLADILSPFWNHTKQATCLAPVLFLVLASFCGNCQFLGLFSPSLEENFDFTPPSSLNNAQRTVGTRIRGRRWLSIAYFPQISRYPCYLSVAGEVG